MAEEKSVLLELNVNLSDALKQMASYNEMLDKIKQSEAEHRAEIKKMEKAIKEKQDAGEKASKEELDSLRMERELLAVSVEQRKKVSKQMSEQSRIVQNSVVATGKYENTLKGLCARLSAAKDELRALNLTDPKWKERAQEVNSLSQQIKELEASYGSHQRNVGNYEESILNALGLNNRFA